MPLDFVEYRPDKQNSEARTFLTTNPGPNEDLKIAQALINFMKENQFRLRQMGQIMRQPDLHFPDSWVATTVVQDKAGKRIGFVAFHGHGDKEFTAFLNKGK